MSIVWHLRKRALAGDIFTYSINLPKQRYDSVCSLCIREFFNHSIISRMNCLSQSMICFLLLEDALALQLTDSRELLTMTSTALFLRQSKLDIWC